MTIESIELPITNLYQNANVFDLGEGELWLSRETFNVTPTEEDFYHTVSKGDELTLLAYDAYKDHTEHGSKLWWVIADANPKIDNVLNLDRWVGQQILIPNWQSVRELI